MLHKLGMLVIMLLVSIAYIYLYLFLYLCLYIFPFSLMFLSLIINEGVLYQLIVFQIPPQFPVFPIELYTIIVAFCILVTNGRGRIRTCSTDQDKHSNCSILLLSTLPLLPYKLGFNNNYLIGYASM